MTNSNYPSLLNKKARIFASLNRMELIILASTYLFLSYLKIGGILALIINIFILTTIKFLKSRFERGFIELIFSKTLYLWQGKLGGLYD